MALVINDRDKARLTKALELNANRDVALYRVSGDDIRDRDLEQDVLSWRGKAHRIRPRSSSDGVQERSQFDTTDFAYTYRLVGHVVIDVETHYLVDETESEETMWELMDRTHGAYDISTFMRVREID